MQSFKDFVAGGVGGACLVLVGQPFDTVKVLLQTRAVAASGPPPSALAVAHELVLSSGPSALYRGMAPVLLGVAPVFALCFWSYGEGKALMRGLSGVQSDLELRLPAIGVAGMLSAVPTTLIMAPGERVKVVMQTQMASGGGSDSARDVARRLLHSGGLRSLYRGAAATLARDGAGSFAYFATYEGLQRRLTPVGVDMSVGAVLLAGGAAGMANWVVALPLDTIKSRIQMEVGASSLASAPPLLPAAQRLVREGGGLHVLYRGLVPVMLRAFPANAACFLGMELSRRALDRWA